jgi:hypothetical protein
MNGEEGDEHVEDDKRNYMVCSSCLCSLQNKITRALKTQAQDSPQAFSSARNDMKSFLQHGQDL